MVSTAIETRPQPRLSDRSRDALAALAGAVFLLAIHAAGGFATLADLGPDNDSLLRLVVVRDLIGGQDWFDPVQHRLGTGDGVAMHWSRLVDAPIAALVLAFGETAALLAWPLLLSAACLFLILSAARRHGGEAAVLPTLVLGAAALHFVGVFKPAALDHHNVQLALALAMLAGLLAPPDRTAPGLAAGAAAALMLAVGMEAVPYVAVGGLVAAGTFLSGGSDTAPAARGFGLGFAGVGAAAFLATVPPGSWGAAQCDAYSVAQFAVAVLAGTGLALAASVPGMTSTLPRRAAALGLLGLACAALVLAAFPQCLADPYATLDPRLKALWLDRVGEAQSLWSLLTQNPGMAISQFATPLIGLALALRALRRDRRRETAVVAALLFAAMLVAVWQVRGATFSIVFAVLPLAAWVGTLRAAAESRPGRAASTAMLGAWLVSFNAVWTGAAAAVELAVDDGEVVEAEGCTASGDHARLAALPAARVLTVSNLGAPVLRNTGHSVLAGPYHRNVEGNLLALDAFMATPDEARAIVEAQRIGIVAFCPGNPESPFLQRQAPDGLMAALMRGAPPRWLDMLPGDAAAPLQLYRVVPQH